MKYRKYSSLVKGLSEFVLRSRGNDEDLWWGVEALIPVPLHPGRKKERGFNQSGLLAKEISRHKNIPVLDRIIKKTRRGPPQTSLSAVNRIRNAKGAYVVDSAERIEGKIVLLIDDVYTTGATLKECSRVLLKAGAVEVRALTIAQA
jgi:competence protein ComFC